MKPACPMILTVSIVFSLAFSVHAEPVPSGFSYQGQLKKDGLPVTNASPGCDFAFRLFDDPSAGNQVGPDLQRTLPVINGLFSVNDLDFGSGAFDGEARWLQIDVHCPHVAPVTLTPRQVITPAPYALHALGSPIAVAKPVAKCAENRVRIQAAIDEAEANSHTDGTTGGKVRLSAGVYDIDDTLYIPSGVSLVGEGSAATSIRYCGKETKDVIRTKHFPGEFDPCSNECCLDVDPNTGTAFCDIHRSGEYCVSDGESTVQHGFQIRGLRIDGNKHKARNGISIFGRRYEIEDVLIFDCSNYGLYSALGPLKACDRAWYDTVEAWIHSLTVGDCGSDGIHFAGPHDSVFGKVTSFRNGGWGIVNKTAAYFMHLHPYANKLGGAKLMDRSYIDFFMGDADWGPALLLCRCALHSQIGKYLGIAQRGRENLVVNASRVTIGQVAIEMPCEKDLYGVYGPATDGARNGIKIDGQHVSIGQAMVIGSGACTSTDVVNGVGLRINESASNFSLSSAKIFGLRNVEGQPRATAIELKAAYSSIQARLSNNDVGFDYSMPSGGHNRLVLDVWDQDSQVALKGFPTPTTVDGDRFSIRHVHNDSSLGNVLKETHNRGKVTVPASSSSVAIPHKLVWTPDLESLSITPTNDTAAALPSWISLPESESGMENTHFIINVTRGVGDDGPAEFSWEARLD